MSLMPKPIILFYYADNGIGEFHATNGSGGLTLKKQHTNGELLVYYSDKPWSKFYLPHKFHCIYDSVKSFFIIIVSRFIQPECE
jgi:hypothetical protein